MVRLQVSHLCDPGSNPGVDAVRGLSLLLVLFFDPGGLSPGTPVFPCPRNQHFQIPIRPGTLCAWVNKLKFLELKPDYLPYGVLQIAVSVLPEHRIAQMTPTVLTIKPKIP